MIIKNSFPPNYEEITKQFKIKGRGDIVFTYGDTLYVPSGRNDIPDHLMAHEETHSKQQVKMGVERWWERYLIDEDFRLKQEVEAYRAQYEILKSNYGRTERRRVLSHLVKDLSGPMYGNIVNKEEAKELITCSV